MGKLTKKDLETILEFIDPKEKELLSPLVEELVFVKKQLDDAKKKPFIDVETGKTTGAFTVYRNLFPQLTSAERILLNTLRKVDSDEADSLLKKLEEFM